MLNSDKLNHSEITSTTIMTTITTATTATSGGSTVDDSGFPSVVLVPPPMIAKLMNSSTIMSTSCDSHIFSEISPVKLRSLDLDRIAGSPLSLVDKLAQYGHSELSYHQHQRKKSNIQEEIEEEDQEQLKVRRIRNFQDGIIVYGSDSISRDKQEQQSPLNQLENAMHSDEAFRQAVCMPAAVIISNPREIFERKSQRFRFVKNWEDKRIQKTSIFASISYNLSDNLLKILVNSNSSRSHHHMYNHTNAFIESSGPQLDLSPPANQLKVQKGGELNIHNHDESNLPPIRARSAAIVIERKHSFQDKINSFQAAFKEIKAKIQKLEKQALSEYENYASVFKATVKSEGKASSSSSSSTCAQKEDFYFRERVYMQFASEHFKQLHTIGQLTLSFMDDVLSSVQEKELTMSNQMESQQSNQLVEQDFEHPIDDLLQPAHANYISRCYDKDEINVAMIRAFMHDFELISTCNKTLIYREFVAQYNGNPVNVAITIDSNLVITPSYSQPQQQMQQHSQQKQQQQLKRTSSSANCVSSQTQGQQSLSSTFEVSSFVVSLPNSTMNYDQHNQMLLFVETQKKYFWKSKRQLQLSLKQQYDSEATIKIAELVSAFTSSNKQSTKTSF